MNANALPPRLLNENIPVRAQSCAMLKSLFYGFHRICIWQKKQA